MSKPHFQVKHLARRETAGFATIRYNDDRWQALLHHDGNAPIEHGQAVACVSTEDRLVFFPRYCRVDGQGATPAATRVVVDALKRLGVRVQAKALSSALEGAPRAPEHQEAPTPLDLRKAVLTAAQAAPSADREKTLEWAGKLLDRVGL